MRRNDYVVYNFKYKGKNYRLFGDEFDYRNGLILQELNKDGSFSDIVNDEIKEYGYKKLFDGEFLKDRFNLKSLKPFKVVLNKKKIKVTPDNVEEVYEELIDMFDLPPLIFGYIYYDLIDSFRIYARGDGYRPIMYGAGIRKEEEERIYKYIYFLQAKFFYDHYESGNLSTFESKNPKTFDLDEFNGARGELKNCLEQLMSTANLSNEAEFSKSITNEAAKESNNKYMIRAMNYLLRLDFKEVRRLRN